uniref:sulfiredoxin n=2 Tax=Timema TaxID=61471 RepID=A0A7R9EQ44_9NEOP|nr:unnamed protein product [Timema bartmani]
MTLSTGWTLDSSVVENCRAETRRDNGTTNERKLVSQKGEGESREEGGIARPGSSLRVPLSQDACAIFPAKPPTCVGTIHGQWPMIRSVVMASLPGSPDNGPSSIHTGLIKEVYDIPMDALIRPFPPEVDEAKVQSLMDTLEDPSMCSLVPPIDVLWIKGRLDGDYYYSFGGCHRYTAHKRLGRKTIKVKLVSSTINDLKIYLGSSTPDLK